MEIIDLEMIPGGPKKTCHASQFDNGRVIRFNLKENGQPFALSGTETVQAIIRKPDGSETTLDIANTSSTYVDLITEADTCDLAGVNHCEMKVTEDGEDLGSGNFDMKVEEDAYGAGDVSVGTASGPIASFETDIKDDLIECVCDIVATGGNGTPDNPNPINGYTEMDIIRSGVNLWDEEWEVGGIDINTGNLIPMLDRIRSKNLIPVKGGSSYYFERANIAGNIFEYDANGNFIRLNGSPTSFTTATNTCFLRFYMASAYGTTYNNDISINYPSTDHTYHPAEIIEKTIQLGQKVYRARINITTGEMTVTWGSVDLGSLTYTKTTAGGYTLFWANITDKAQNTNSLCESYKNSNNGRDSLLNNEYGTYNLSALKNTIAIRDDAKASLSEADFKTAMAGILFIYELANPVSIQLTPEQIETLVGQNNVYHTANGDTAVKFYTRA